MFSIQEHQIPHPSLLVANSCEAKLSPIIDNLSSTSQPHTSITHPLTTNTMPPPRTITDSDADTSPISPSASSVRPSPPPTTIALGASRKRSASSDPTSADHPSTTPEPEEQLSEEAKAEEKRAKQIVSPLYWIGLGVGKVLMK
ncbi:hypothetical protein VC83_00400 [Pseudogymnoascus destructans]|uniref:Uncharacterized protein n=1 Tax=Pseudogymnoascus destructans TaxID=655981 RepID=A0A177AN06_9PEZI|nr:uncharacterized protein VC83_00400 [Pseudogymnoascus destructans]OAF63457.1 hypothetical protein VC83_00400 [Pseudogymnoascus destructans]